jgi:septal ring factor EnvC (AmiA/AmiB activator)
MGLRATAKKTAKLTTKAEEIYTIAKKLHDRLNSVKEEITGIRETIDRVDTLLHDQQDELVYQRRVIDAIAEEHDIDVGEFTLDQSTEPPDEQSKQDEETESNESADQ